MTDQLTDGRVTEQTGFDNTTKPSDVPESRQRILTEKGQQMYIENVNKYKKSLVRLSQTLKDHIYEAYTCSKELSVLTTIQQNLQDSLKRYEDICREFCEYLDRQHTEDSQHELNAQTNEFQMLVKKVNTVMNNLQEMIDSHTKKATTLKSQSSVKSNTSKKSQQLAEEARTRLKIAEQAAELKRQKSKLFHEEEIRKSLSKQQQEDLDTEIELLKFKEDLEIANTRVKYEQDLEEEDSIRQPLNVPSISGDQKSRTFIKSLTTTLNPNAEPFISESVTDQQQETYPCYPETQTHGPSFNQPQQRFSTNASPVVADTVDISTLFIKKNILLETFQQQGFDDKPDRYVVWKNQFKNIVAEIKCSALETITLLTNCINKNTDAYRLVMSTRSSCVVNPDLCLQNIWNRLDERFGSPEHIESSLQFRLTNIQEPADRKKLYDLHDLLCEIQAIKNIDTYSVVFSYLDSSLGIKPIVQKLSKPLQDKWVTRVVNYKKQHGVLFPPFQEFVSFVGEMSVIRNDPGLMYEVPKFKNTNQPHKNQNKEKPSVSTRKVDINQENKRNYNQCIIHKESKHSINNCKAFQNKSVEERKRLLREHNICFRCCETSQHFARNCDVNTQCNICKSTFHPTALHSYGEGVQFSSNHGEEKVPTSANPANKLQINSNCTELCGNFRGKSCARIVPVYVYLDSQPENSILTYAMLDDQSNKTLAKSFLFDSLGIKSSPLEYTMQSCSGRTVGHGRITDQLIVKDLSGKVQLELPPVLECDDIPENQAEIPTPHVAHYYPHMSDIADYLHPVDPSLKILLLIGRDLPEAHHVIEQRIGPPRSPFAQRSPLGWTIIGDVCLSGQHLPSSFSNNKTFINNSGRPSVLEPCEQMVNIQSTIVTCNRTVLNMTYPLFETTVNDNKIGLSVEDRQFLDVMDREFRLDKTEGKWTAPLPFRSLRSRLPDNFEHALTRAQTLDKSLYRNQKKKEHFFAFMQKVLESNHAELAPDIPPDKERWYLPLFGVYHPRKPDQIRGVFDSSAKFEGVCLNDQLLQGPDFINSLLGILIRFRKEKIAVVADIQSMFHSFLVNEDYRDYLRFLWHEDNILENPLVTYRMRVHVFGNRPSPSIAMYGLQRIGELASESHGKEVKNFIINDFYVDDGLASYASSQEAINILRKTQDAMKVYGDVRLHKFASNCETVLRAFDSVDLAKSVIDLNLEKDIPTQRSLGLLWDLQADEFKFEISPEIKPTTRRGVLSTVNSLYDPLGFIAPVTIQGKLILRKVISFTTDWDEPLPDHLLLEWDKWRSNLPKLETLRIPRVMVSNLCESHKKELLIYCDASEHAIATVCYLHVSYANGSTSTGFVLGKAKVAPVSGHTIPRLELCAAVLAVDVAQLVKDHLQIDVNDIKFFSDSRVVLGYINNDKKRFYVYVANRVAHIRKFSDPSQWYYIRSEMNPADVSTRGISADDIQTSIWLHGPEISNCFINSSLSLDDPYPLIEPNEDKEIRCKKTEVKDETCLSNEFYSKFSNWNRLLGTVAALHRFIQVCRKCVMSDVDLHIRGEQTIVKDIQFKVFSKELSCLQASKPLNKNSPLYKLNPYIDQDGILRVGGRLKKLDCDGAFKNPVILPAKHHVITLLVRKLHSDVKHQGRHLTEGHIRSSGYWILGGKSLISSVIHKCVICRKLRKGLNVQQMSNLPEERITPGQPPFSAVGVDMFGPWEIITRRTRGGSANSKRWAAIFTCLSTRAVHIEVVEEMTSSSFINALKRFIAIRGNVNIFRSDRGTNFVGAVKELNFNAINVEDGPVGNFLLQHKVSWIFNPPHSSHMGGVWERMIGNTRRILDAMLLEYGSRTLTHEVLVTFLAEAAAIINSRPLVSVSTDPENPFILSPSTLLTQKIGDSSCSYVASDQLDRKDLLRNQWKRVQHLASTFWKRWRMEYLSNIQSRRKWHTIERNVTPGDVVLVRD
ncbi:uncharacterized protein LOC111129274 [Crassostrea virginica]